MAQDKYFEQANLAFIIPPELFLKIMRYLDWKGLLSLKQTCKKLYALTKARQFWYSYIEELQSAGIPPPEAPLDDYTAEELERWVLRRLRVREQWQPETRELLPFRLRQTKNYAQVKNCTFLPGGRWLVGTTLTGKFYAVDLDLRESAPHLLIDPGDLGGDPEDIPARRPSWDYAIWIDPSKPRLTFRVALISTTIGELGHAFIHEAELRGHGPEAAFSVKRLTEIADMEEADKKADLNNSYYIEVNQYWEPNQMIELHVYSYFNPQIEPDSSSSIKPLIVKTSMSRDSPPGYICILTPDLIGVMDYQFFYIFSFTQLKQSSANNVVSPLHQVPVTNFSVLISQPICMSNSTCFLVLKPREKLRVVHIPHDVSCPPTLKQVDYQVASSDAVIGLGSSSAIVFHADYSMEVISFTWDEENDDLSVKHIHGQRSFDFCSPLHRYYSCTFEDTMGRVVLTGVDGLEILDVEML